MIGVLAIISILVLVLVPVLMKEVDRQTRKDEEARLKSASEAFQNAAMRNRAIAGATNWATVLAAQLGWRIEDVLTNRRANARVFLIDPALRVGLTSSSVLPFTQTWQGSLPPTSARIVLLSSVGEPLPSDLVSGVAASTSAFNAVWEAAPETMPAGWSWSGRASDLCVQRITLTPLFSPVVLNNFDGSPGKYGVDTSVTNTMTTNTFSTWHLRSTELRLHGNNNLLQSTEVVQTPVSYVYENGIWRGRAFMSMSTKRLAGQDLQDAVDLFLSAPRNVNAKNSVTQSNVVAALTSYMQKYLTWANGGFSYQTSDIKPVKDAQTLIGNYVTDLIFKP